MTSSQLVIQMSKEQMDIDWELDLDIEDIFLESMGLVLCRSWFPRKILFVASFTRRFNLGVL